MKIVVDTNVIISALIKKGYTRKIIFESEDDFFTPSFSMTEIKKYKKYILKKSGLSSNDFDFVLKLIFEKVKIVPFEIYEDKIRDSRFLIDDKKDIPFLALARGINSKIWSDDRDFEKQNKVDIIKTKDLVKKYFK